MTPSGNDCRTSNSELFQAIWNAPLPDFVTRQGEFQPSKTETFQQRLASKHDLTEESARRLVEEYRRFLYLKAIDGGPLTPSKRVDQAWHLHMEAAGMGWTQFCDDVLKFRIDHRTGLSKTKAMASYVRLFELYRREFNHEPPGDIWPGAHERKQRAFGFAMVFAGVVLARISWIPWESSTVGFGASIGFLVGVALVILGIAVLKGTDLEMVAKCA